MKPMKKRFASSAGVKLNYEENQMDTFKLTEDDFDNLIEAVGLWGKDSPDMDEGTSEILSNLLICGDKKNLERLIKEKRKEFSQRKKQRERDAAMLSAKLITIQRQFMDSPSTFNLEENLK